MKLIAVMIASLFLITASSAQGEHTKRREEIETDEHKGQ